jgi:hypothetical protein
VKFARLLAEGLGQLVLRRAGLDTEEIVEGDIGAVCFSNFVTDAEDFVVCGKLSASSSQLELGKCMWGRRICGRKHAMEDETQQEKLRTLLSPGSCECCKEAQGQCEQRVRSHGWG